jgi:hypothetical protein
VSGSGLAKLLDCSLRVYSDDDSLTLPIDAPKTEKAICEGRRRKVYLWMDRFAVCRSRRDFISGFHHSMHD